MTTDQDNDIAAAQRRKNRLHELVHDFVATATNMAVEQAHLVELGSEGMAIDYEEFTRRLREAVAGIPQSTKDLYPAFFVSFEMAQKDPERAAAIFAFVDSHMAQMAQPSGPPAHQMQKIGQVPTWHDYEAGLVDPSRNAKMTRTLDRLFLEAPKMEDAVGEQAAALDCQITFRSGQQARGSLGKTPEGGLRFMAIANGPRGEQLALEYFFDVDDLETVVVMRAQTQAAPQQPTIFQG